MPSLWPIPEGKQLPRQQVWVSKCQQRLGCQGELTRSKKKPALWAWFGTNLLPSISSPASWAKVASFRRQTEQAGSGFRTSDPQHSGLSGCIKLFHQSRVSQTFPSNSPKQQKKWYSSLGGGLKKTENLPSYRFILRFLGSLGHPFCPRTTRYSEESPSPRRRTNSKNKPGRVGKIFGVSKTWIQKSALFFSNCVPLGEVLNFPVPQFIYLETGDFSRNNSDKG